MNSLAWCLLVALTLFLTVALSAAEEDVKELKIEVTKSVDCTRKTKNGDTISMHYKVSTTKWFTTVTVAHS